MASIKSKGFLNPQFMPGNGVGMVIVDELAVAANPTANDTWDFKIPAGMLVTEVALQCPDMDTDGTPAIVFGVGYSPIQANSIYTEDLTYFAAAGQTTMQAGGRLNCAFVPKKFEEDVMLRVKIGTAADVFAAGSVYAIISGAAKGVI